MTELSFSDGTISGITSRPGLVIVEFLDWQEKSWSLVFFNAIAYKSISCEGEEISELNVSDETELSKEAMLIEGGTGRNFCFISAWSNSVVLTVVAEDYEATAL